MILIVLLIFVGYVSAEPCDIVIAGTPCLCVNAGTEGTSGGAIQGCGNASPTGLTDGAGDCVTADGLCVPNGFVCCHACGDNVVNSAVSINNREQCDPGSIADDCCAATCRFEAVGANCENPTDSVEDGTCGGQDTCAALGVCTENSATSGTLCDNLAVAEDPMCGAPDTCNGNGACTENHMTTGTPCTDGKTCNGAETCTSGVCVASSCGDPHIYGPHGEEFFFGGVEGGVYALFATTHFAVNVQLTKVTITEKAALFMTEVGVMFANTTTLFTIGTVPDLKKLNDVLTSIGARASGSDSMTVLDLCVGHRVVIKKTIGKLHAPHFDVTVEVPGCHDNFHGIVGQLYQCKFAASKFQWNRATEESFRVPSVTSVDEWFDANQPCLDLSEFGVQT